MPMSPSARKLALTAHVSCSVGVVGAVAAFLVLSIAGVANEDVQVISAAYLSMDVLAKDVIVPLALASLISGFIQSLGTHWGLLRHRWIVAKLLITSFATAVLLAKLKLIGHAAALVLETDVPLTELRAAGIELVLHAAGGLFVLLVPTALSIYKPRALTEYGRRKQQELMTTSSHQPPLAPLLTRGISEAHGGAITFTLRRGHVFSGVMVVLVVHLFILHFTGTGHGLH
jgi:hypothetical protein